MENKKEEIFIPKVWIYHYEDNHKKIYSRNGVDFNKYHTESVFIKIAEILVKTKLPVKCIFWVGFYPGNDFSVGIERVGDFYLEEGKIEVFSLNPDQKDLDVLSELISFFVKRADKYSLKVEALQKKVIKMNKEFICSFRITNKLLGK